MKKKGGGGEGGGANWMDTYGDMVTLLLCFFVLLYSMSTINEDKWKAAAISFNPNAVTTPTIPEDLEGINEGPVQDPNLEGNMGDKEPSDKEKEQEETDQAIEQLYQMMKEYIEKSGKNVEITKGDGGVFLSFANAVFFDGDSDVLRQDGKEMLDVLAPMLSQAAEHIDEIRILGHTAQASATEANTTEGDRMLAATRAARVTAYLQDRVTGLSAGRMVSEGFGQHRPVAPNDVEENRRKNRRVEMIITGKDLMNELGGTLEQYETIRENGPSKASVEDKDEAPDQGQSQSSSQTESSAAGGEG
ncbi:MAG: OmpA family protein [Acutalibacter sp.]|nr:OmpA family protein [Acutalibacter sp.]